jgi:hypothetical protein
MVKFKGHSQKMFKRPIPLRRAPERTQFVSEISKSGALVSQWLPIYSTEIVASGTPGRVGEILDKMRTGLDPKELPPPIWKPSIDYKFIAATMPPAEAEAYITRSEEWFAIHTKNCDHQAKVQLDINREPVLAVFKKYWPHCPPVDEHMEALKEAGYPDSKIEKVARWHKWRVDTDDSRQEALDAIFSKWPAASKPTPKARKVIKAVKKKI